jgi:membrane protease YdiL (CAAX protease family)
MRVLSLSSFVFPFSPIFWYVVMSIALITAAFLTAKAMGWSMDSVGINLRSFPIQVLVALSGLVFGLIEYAILQPKPLIESLTWEGLAIPAMILVISTGFTEELIFRGMLQKAGTRAMGTMAGLLIAAVVFAVVHLGNQSLLDLVFLFAMGLFFGWVVLKTRSIIGTSTAHGLNNVVLMLVAPLLPIASVSSPLDLPGIKLPLSALPIAVVAASAEVPESSKVSDRKLEDLSPEDRLLAASVPVHTEDSGERIEGNSEERQGRAQGLRSSRSQETSYTTATGRDPRYRE